MRDTKFDITASVVLYHNEISEIEQVIDCFLSSTLKGKLYLIDNSATAFLGSCFKAHEQIEYIFVGKNLGYGKAHNLAINRSTNEANYHVVLNPDISFSGDILNVAFEYMNSHTDIGMLSPAIYYPNGEPQYMCRLLPTPFDLFGRRFLPGLLKSFFKKRMDSYILKDLDYQTSHNIPNLPGSFMFLRNAAIAEVGAFDEHFFMYLEDVDLTRRIHKKYKTLYYPQISIEHKHDRGSYHSKLLMFYHVKSAIYYFNKWGWFHDRGRKRVNSDLLKKNRSF